MEFQKLQKIIGDVLEVDPEEIGPETAFVEDLGPIPWIFSRL